MRLQVAESLLENDPSRRNLRGHMNGIKGQLPTPQGKQTFREEDSSSSFFGLSSFTL